jgi:hypothetical protein
MGIWAFYFTALGRAFVESVSLAQAVVFVIVAAVGLLGRRRLANAAHVWVTSGRVALIILVALVCARLPFAVYDLWNEEHTKRLHAECLQNRAHDVRQQRQEFVSQKLQSFYVKAQELMHRRIVADEFSVWANAEGSLAKEMTDWVKSNMGDGAAAKLLDMNGPGYDFSGMPTVNADHVGALNWLNKVSSNLAALQERPEWDIFRAPLPPECS